MARKDKPYLPLYIQDFMTDEKLMECSASATGVYIRIMCVMHKSIKYGTFLLKQKDKQNGNQILNFASKLGKHLPYDLPVIISGLEELINEGCLIIEGDILIQKRMMEDGVLSEKRSKSGSNGGKKTQSKHIENKDFAKAKNKAKPEANSDIDIDIDIDVLSKDLNEISNNTKGQKIEIKHPDLFKSMMGIFKTSFPAYFDDYEADYPACISIAQKTEKLKNWASNSVLNGHLNEFLDFWGEVVQYVANDAWLSSRSLKDLSTREWQRLGQHMSKPPKERNKKATKDDKKSEYEKEIEAKREAARNKTFE